MTERPLRRLATKPALRVEEIDEILQRFRNDLSGAANELARATTAGGDEVTESRVPDLSDRADEVLREWLEEETLALIEPEGPRGIEEHELHQEILKKALAGLKREVLQELARTKKLVPASKLDDLARQVARAYDWDEPAIARVVLDYTQEPKETEGGYSTRIFTLRDSADLSSMAGRLNYVNGRYYRTDIAKWFVFDEYRRVGPILRVNGTLQSYRAIVDPASDDRLSTEQDIAGSELEVREGRVTALVHGARTHAVAKSMLAAFKVATLAETLNHVPNAGSDAEVVPHALHPNTLFLLDVITHRMRGYLFRHRNPVLARFRFTNRVGSTSEESSRKPTLRAVRFEGENLLDSPTACGLMWTEGRPLVDLTVSVAATESETDSTIRARVPIRIALEKDAVLVSTGLVSDSKLAAEVHRTVVGHVEAAIAQAVSPERQSRLERTIKSMAANPDPEADAQLLDDELGGDIDLI